MIGGRHAGRAQELSGAAALRWRSALDAARERSATWWATAAILGALALVSLWVRSRALHAGFWVDEGLSVGIASHHLTAIPHLLRRDGSPPGYYLLLNLWMRIAGRGEAATHALSLLAALLTIPAAWWAGSSAAGRRAGLTCAVLAAASPFLTVYAQETRMYSLAALLATLTAGCFCQAFVLRRRRFVPLFALSLAGLLYTHNWGLFLAVGAAAALVPCLALARDRRRLMLDAAAGFAAAGLLYLPWIPTLLFQAAHTGAPWSRRPTLQALPAALEAMLGTREAIAFLVAGVVGAAAVWRRRRARGGAGVAVAASLLVMCAVGLLCAFVVARQSPGWAVRYLAVFVGPALVLIGVLLARAGLAGAVALAAVAVWGFLFAGQVTNKSNAKDIARELRGRLLAGDLVITTQPEQDAVLHYYLPAGVRFADPRGPVADPGVMDWRDATRALARSRVPGAVAPLLRSLPRGARVLLVTPARSGGTTWARLVRVRSRQWRAYLASDGAFRRVLVADAHRRGVADSRLTSVLYRKR